MTDLALLLFALALVAFVIFAWWTFRALLSAWAETTYWRNEAEFYARGVDLLTADLKEEAREQINREFASFRNRNRPFDPLPDNELFAEAAE